MLYTPIVESPVSDLAPDTYHDIAWHEDRASLFAELHSRPFKIIESDALITHVATLANQVQREQQHQTLLAFLQQLNVDVERIEGSCQVYHAHNMIIADRLVSTFSRTHVGCVSHAYCL
jgi:hypothetical protein